jgi:hypothetical protein
MTILRARDDSAFRYKLVVSNLPLLLDEISKMRAVRSDAMECKEIREGVKLAVQLSSLLQRIASQAPTASTRPNRPTPCDGLRTGPSALPFRRNPV